MNRRSLIAGATALAMARVAPDAVSGAAAAEAECYGLDFACWAALDADIGKDWIANVCFATEAAIRNDSSGLLLYLPFPYVSPTAPGSIYQFMFGWDTDFVSQALLAQGQRAQALNHILNYFFMIDRYGYMPNANNTRVLTRSQTPLIADTAWRYYLLTRDRGFLQQAYPRLKKNYLGYWTAAHHRTPIGLATNRDLGDAALAARLAAEAETGLDWTPIYNGDVRQCVPLITNCALVRYANIIAKIAMVLKEDTEAAHFFREASDRAAAIRHYCWNKEAGYFVEYDFVHNKQLSGLSDSAFWTLWAGVATPTQARLLVRSLIRIEHDFGLSCTDTAYGIPSPTTDYGPPFQFGPDGTAAGTDSGLDALGGPGPLQWMYPAGWAPSHLITVEGLDSYGYSADAHRIASKFLKLIVAQHAKTGHLWEKYNVVDGSLYLPNSRYGNLWMRGWTAAAVALLGRRVFHEQKLRPNGHG